MYKATIGLEVHVELKTNSKNFSSAKNAYSLEHNTNITEIDLGYPGILPVVNKEAVKKALKVALALNCKTPEYLIFDRKNYFYPDLPKGYQITQLHHPVGIDGYLMINVGGVDKKVLIHDTHLEEDTASMEHLSNYSLIDYNRAGIPLLETVTEPCLNSADEAIAFLEALRSLFLYCDISEARSDLGQIRCDVNVSLAKDTDTNLGTRVEMKNINSFSAVRSAILCEIKRQTEILENGGKVEQETRRYDETSDMTYLMRSKVDAIDYKYYIEPNLPPIKISKDFLEEIKKEIPTLQYERLNNYIDNYNLTRVEATTLIKEKALSDYFEKMISLGVQPKFACNWLVGFILGYLNKNYLSIVDIKMTPEMLKKMIDLLDSGKISIKQMKEILTKALEEDKDPNVLVKELNIYQITDSNEIRIIVNEVLDENINLVEDYKNGKRVLDFIIGQIMKKTKGRVNPLATSKILQEELDKR